MTTGSDSLTTDAAAGHMGPPPPRWPSQRSNGPSGKKVNTAITRDQYGFIVPTPYSSLYRDFRRIYDIEEGNRNKSWGTWLESYDGRLAWALEFACGLRSVNATRNPNSIPESTTPQLANQELRVLVKAGVPKEYRKEVWKAFLVGRRTRSDEDCTLGAYSALVGQMEAPEYQDDLDQISKDLHRTFPNHELTNTAGGKARLRRVLGAYAVRNPLVGYCQGLNFIAATFLLVFVDWTGGKDEEIVVKGGDAGEPTEDEAAAFWCFVALVEEILTGYFDPMMVNQQVDGLVFEQLVREILPEVAAHFDDVGVHVPTAVAGWFLVAFVNSLPSEATMRVWDVLFFEKCPAVLFRVGIGLLSVYKEAILECRNDSDLYMLVQALGPITFDASSLVDAMGDFSHVKGSILMVLRDKYAPGVTKVMEKMFHAGDSGANGRGLGSGSGMSSAKSSRGSPSGFQHSKYMTSAMSTDIEKRLGILRLRHKDSATAAVLNQASHVGDGDQQRFTQDSLRRTQSALTECTPGIVLHGRNERLQQELRINLLAMRTFVPDMKLLTTALQIASGNVHRNERDQSIEEEDRGRGSVAGANPATVPRRFTDGGALLSSPFKQGTIATATMTAMGPNSGPNAVITRHAPSVVQSLPLEKLRNIESMKSALSSEVSHSIQLLEEISASNVELETSVSEMGEQLSKVQDEIEHKVSTYEALFQRANELQDQAKTIELTYRKQLTTNIQLADSWRSISKDIKKNDTTLKMLMDLAESRASAAAGGAELARTNEPESPTKKFRKRVKAMVNRKFTR